MSMKEKKEYLEEYQVLRGGSLISIPVGERDMNIAWKISIRKVKGYKYIGSSTMVTLGPNLTLPANGGDFYKFIPASASDLEGELVEYIDDYENDLASSESYLRGMYLESDLLNMSNWIISAKYNPVTEVIDIDNYGGHKGERCLMLYELSEEYFSIKYLSYLEQEFFLKTVYGTLDKIVGAKLLRAGRQEEGDRFISEGSEALMSLDEEAKGVFIRPALLFI